MSIQRQLATSCTGVSYEVQIARHGEAILLIDGVAVPDPSPYLAGRIYESAAAARADAQERETTRLAPLNLPCLLTWATYPGAAE